MSALHLPQLLQLSGIPDGGEALLRLLQRVERLSGLFLVLDALPHGVLEAVGNYLVLVHVHCLILLLLLSLLKVKSTQFIIFCKL